MSFVNRAATGYTCASLSECRARIGITAHGKGEECFGVKIYLEGDACRLGSVGWESDDFCQGAGAGGEHDQAVEAERDAGAGWQTKFHGGQ